MKTHMRHVESVELLRYVDGELAARAAGKVRGHLESCWQCRAGLEDVQATIGDCVRYRKVLQRCLPSPPAPWFDIFQGFAEIDAASEPGFFARLAGLSVLTARNRKAWAAAAVALAVIVTLVYRFQESPSVQAAELLRKAVVAANSRPETVRRISIRTKQHHLTRMAGSRLPARLKAADSAAADSLQAMFLAARFDWDDPLSARAFQAWRNQLPTKRDEVTREGNGYRVHTSTTDGVLASATLELRIPDLRPVAERLDFRNQDFVEITEAPAGEGPSPEPEVLSSPAPQGILHSRVEMPEKRAGLGTPEASIGDELHAVAALHQVGADLGDPIEISRAGGNVLVTGVGIAPQRQQQIETALAAEPRVIVRFSEPAPAKGQPEAETRAEATVSGDVRALQAQIAQQVGGRARFDQLAAQVLDLSDAMMSRVYALRRLAERFSPQTEAALGPEDQRILAGLRQEHIAVVRQKTNEIDRLLRPALLAVSPAAVGPPENPVQTSWQSGAQDLFQSARSVEKLAAVMFGAAPGESADLQLPSRLLASLAQLRARAEAINQPVTGRSDR